MCWLEVVTCIWVWKQLENRLFGICIYLHSFVYIQFIIYAMGLFLHLSKMATLCYTEQSNNITTNLTLTKAF